jgi:muramoyltetrapeptide carboxypeptidase LdcA involved in peptidoglycan recycling
MPNFREYLASSYPVLYCQTHELNRAIEELSKIAMELDFQSHVWDCQRGITDLTATRFKNMTPENLPKEL